MLHRVMGCGIMCSFGYNIPFISFLAARNSLCLPFYADCIIIVMTEIAKEMLHEGIGTQFQPAEQCSE
jgi:hypothetical protein